MNLMYPWQQQEWQRFLNSKNIGKLPHAILIKGAEGLGKYNFALCIAESLLCGEYTNHPDLIIVEPEEQKAIKIDQIREAITDLNNTSQQGGYKIVIIKRADLLNNAASNSLLKTLEEPADNIMVILISHNPTALSATIRSRCQIIAMKSPSFLEAEKWLKQNSTKNDSFKLVLALTENAPLKALSILQEDNLKKRLEFFHYLYELQNKKMSAVQVAEKYLDWDLNSFLLILMSVISDIVKIKFSAVNNIINQDQVKELVQLSVKININKIFSYQATIIKLRQHLMKNINSNQQLTIESLIINWDQLFDAS